MVSRLGGSAVAREIRDTATLMRNAAFGAQTVTFVTFTEAGSPGALGTYAMTETKAAVKNCRHRPLTFKETAETDTDIATEMWKTTAPPEAAVLAAEASGVIEVDGERYQIIGGIRHHVDMDGAPFKVTIISQKQIG